MSNYNADVARATPLLAYWHYYTTTPSHVYYRPTPDEAVPPITTVLDEVVVHDCIAILGREVPTVWWNSGVVIEKDRSVGSRTGILRPYRYQLKR